MEHNNTVLVRNNEPESTLQETAQAIARIEKAMWKYLAQAGSRLHHGAFPLNALARSHGLSTVFENSESIEETVQLIGSISFKGPKNPEAYLRNSVSLDQWEEAEAIFSDTVPSKDVQSELYIIAKLFVTSLNAYSNRRHVLITDLLPRLVELNQIDLKMQTVLRRRWSYIDMIMDRWYVDKRKEMCGVPDWYVVLALCCLLHR